ncbi:tetratricopeptide repeat protein [Iodidimonas sp. SYSU 1G8]|uniref:tetratricopeptide repeat protein n=1 Tax=Iodidimonas sp. SYSU 1G8 TaxID=3133967 RepID=UPI0031FE8E73
MDVYRQVIDLIVTAPDRKPAGGVPRMLDSLFAELAAPHPPRPVDETESMIWSVWTSHPHPNAADGMARALRMMRAGSYEVAERELDRVVATFPMWAEGWNKRATVLFLMDRDEDSVADIVQTLRLEPRHFGALSGYGQICLRRGDEAGALIAFEEALRIHPHLDSMRDAVADLNQKLGGLLN